MTRKRRCDLRVPSSLLCLVIIMPQDFDADLRRMGVVIQVREGLPMMIGSRRQFSLYQLSTRVRRPVLLVLSIRACGIVVS